MTDIPKQYQDALADTTWREAAIQIAIQEHCTVNEVTYDSLEEGQRNEISRGITHTLDQLLSDLGEREYISDLELSSTKPNVWHRSYFEDLSNTSVRDALIELYDEYEEENALWEREWFKHNGRPKKRDKDGWGRFDTERSEAASANAQVYKEKIIQAIGAAGSTMEEVCLEHSLRKLSGSRMKKTEILKMSSRRAMQEILSDLAQKDGQKREVTVYEGKVIGGKRRLLRDEPDPRAINEDARNQTGLPRDGEERVDTGDDEVKVFRKTD